MGNAQSCYTSTILKSDRISEVSLTPGPLIAKGNFGAVYEWDVKFGASDAWVTVACKSVKCGKHTFEHVLKEYQKASFLQHDNVVEVFGYQTVGRGEGKGGDVRIFMERLQPIPYMPTGVPAEMLKAIGHDVAKALAHIHGRIHIHGDLKPSNVLYDAAHNRYKLADFGLCAMLQKITDDDGTIKLFAEAEGAYMKHIAPEVLMSGLLFNLTLVTPASDIFAYGLTLCRFALGDEVASNLGIDGLQASDAIPAVLHDCIAMSASKRPSATELVAAFS